MAFLAQLLQMIHQHVEFGAGFGGALDVQQAGMAGSLAQAQEGFEHVHPGLGQSLGLHAGEQRVAVMLAQFVVLFSL